MITVYDDETSTAGYAVRALLGILALPHRWVAIEEYDAAHPDDLPPPVVVVDDQRQPPAALRDPWAALMYLARMYDSDGTLLAADRPARHADVLGWVMFAGDLARTAGVARRHESFGEPLQPVDARECAHALLAVMDRRLWFGEAEDREFLAGDFSLADLACFGEVALCEEGGIPRQDYPALRRWCDRVKRVPGLPLMSGIFPAASERV